MLVNERVDGRAEEMTREELLRRAEALLPSIRARTDEGERLRRCPDATIEDLIGNGLLRICQPARYGGFELGYDVMCEVSQTLSRACGSQGWVHMVYADNALKLSAFPLEAQDEVWSRTHDVKIAVAIAQVGKAKPADGGVLWTGRHGFSSGIDQADWVICGGHIYRDGVQGEACFVMVPQREVTVIDDWHVTGLVGTGSKSFELRDVFVPAHRILMKKAVDEGTAPGQVFHKAPVFRLPRGGVSAVSYTCVVVGIAEGFLEEYLRFTAPRKSRGTPVAEQPGTQFLVGLAAAEIEAASRMYLGAIRECMETLARGERVGREQNLQGKRNACYACQLALRAVQRLFNAAGGRALYLDNDLQRKFRDVHAAAAHHSLVWDTAAANWGRFALAKHRGGTP